MAANVSLTLKDYDGGAPVSVAGTYDGTTITLTKCLGNTYKDRMYVQMHSVIGGEPLKVPVIIHDDGTIEWGTVTDTAVAAGYALFNQEGLSDFLQVAVSIASTGVPTFTNVTVTGSGAPTYDSSRIGPVGNDTVEVRFSEKVTSADFTAGVTIKKNTVAQNILSGTLQANENTVYYVLDADADANDTVTWEYSKAAGDIADKTTGVVLENVTAKTVTNLIDALAPEFDSAEIGAVLDTTVAVTFTEKVSAAGNDYSTGVTIQVNGSDAVIASGTRQADHHVVYYVIPAVDADDVVTIAYDDSTGVIVNEDDGGVMATFAAQPVTNTVTPVPPTLASAEVGTVNATTVAVVFSVDVKAAGDDFTTGVTIKKGGVAQAISAGVQQASHDTIYYTIPAVANGDVVTIEYDDTTGLIQNEADSAPLATFAAQPVTNNVA